MDEAKSTEIPAAKSAGRAVAKATGVMIVAITLSRLLGFVRESLLMAYFGQGALTDVYKQSFMVPDMLYFLIAGGALSSAFIPVFTRYLAEGKEEEAWKTFSVVGCTALISTAVFIVIGEIFAVPMSRLVSPGFIPVQVQQMAYLTRIVLPAQAFFFLGGLMIGTLHSRQHFLAPAIGPLIYTVGIIAGGLISAHIHGDTLRYLHSPEIASAMRTFSDPHASAAQKALVRPVVEHALRIGTPAVSGYSWGALIGAFIGNLCLQFMVMRKLGWRFIPSLDFKFEGARKVFALMLPVLLGLSLPQVDMMICKYFATFLSAGSVTAVDNANRLMQVPYGTLGTAFAMALFPTLAALAAQNLWGDFKEQIGQGIRRMLFLALPSSTLLMVLAIPAVRLVFQHGKLMTGEDTLVTAITLVLFSVGIFAWCMQALISRGFYSLHDTKTVVISGTVMTVIFVVMLEIFMHSIAKKVWWAPAGLAFFTSVSAVMQALSLLWLLRRRVGGMNGRVVGTALGKMCIACLAMAAAAYPFYRWLEHKSGLISGSGDLGGTAATGIEILLVAGVGLAVYAGAARLMGLEELDSAASMLLGRFRRKSA
ncbi:MAG: murein biosynthesis integral membrane protein MurJ [Armatimonadota bacterium]